MHGRLLRSKFSFLEPIVKTLLTVLISTNVLCYGSARQLNTNQVVEVDKIYRREFVGLSQVSKSLENAKRRQSDRVDNRARHLFLNRNNATISNLVDLAINSTISTNDTAANHQRTTSLRGEFHRESNDSSDYYDVDVTRDVVEEHKLKTEDTAEINTALASKGWDEAEKKQEIADKTNFIESECGRFVDDCNDLSADAQRAKMSSLPFIVCNSLPNISGYERSVRIIEDTSDMTDADMSDLVDSTIYNGPDKTCYQNFMTFSAALEILNQIDYLSLQPMTSLLILQEGIIKSILEEDNSLTGFNAAFCRGVTETDSAQGLVDEIISGLRNDGFEYSWVNDLPFAQAAALECENWSGNINFSLVNNNLSFDFSINDETSSELPECVLAVVMYISNRAEICSLGALRREHVSNLNAQWLVQNVEYEREGTNPKPFFKAGIKGQNQIVALSDTGLDMNSCYFREPNGSIRPSKTGNFDRTKRKVIQYYSYVDALDGRGHGTHVAGTIAGCNVGSESDEHGEADGIAPGARIAFFDIGSGGTLEVTIPPPDVIFSPGITAGAKIHSASWGNSVNAYGNRDADWDDFTFNEDQFLIVKSAGNTGDDCSNGYDCDNSVSGVSKNILTVGATQSAADDLDAGMKGHEYVAHFSARGPSADFRIKPEVLAPGYWVRSALSGQSCSSTWLRGTSMATPVVAGTAALIRQYFADGFYPSGQRNSNQSKPIITSSLVKAVLINGSQKVNGVDNGPINKPFTTSAPYDEHQGFGRISLRHSLPLKSSRHKFDIQIYDRKEILFNDNPDDYQYTITKCSSSELRATLVWHERGSSPGCTKCVLNDLDLSATITRNGISRHFKPNGQDFKDDKNNAERLIIPDVNENDKVTVTVNAFNLADQNVKYSLVVTGCLRPPNNNSNNNARIAASPLSDQQGCKKIQKCITNRSKCRDSSSWISKNCCVCRQTRNNSNRNS